MSQTAARPHARTRAARRALLNLAIDLALVVSFLVAYNLRFSGLTIHEWLGIAMGAVLVVHALLHGDWVVATARRLGRRLLTAQGARFVLGVLMLVDMTVLVATGILISRSAVPGLFGSRDPFWRWLHVESARWAIYLVAAHFALGLRYLLNVVRRRIVDPLRGRGRLAPAAGPGGER